MTKYMVEITASSSLDKSARPIGLSVDKALPSNFYELYPETIIGSGYQYFAKTVEVDIPEGEHTVYVAIPSPPATPWKVDVYIKGLVSGTHITSQDSPWSSGVTVPVAPPEAIPEEIPEELPEELIAAGVTREALIKAITSAEEAAAALKGYKLAVPPTVTSLPWYMSWLQPVLDYGGQITESVTNFWAPILAPIGEVLGDIPKTIQLGVSALVSSLQDIWGALTNASIGTVTQTQKGLAEGSPEWEKELDKHMQTSEEKLITGYSGAIDVTKYRKSPITGAEAIKSLETMRTELIAVALANFSLHAASEAGSLGQFEAWSQFEPMVASKYGLDAIVRMTTMMPIEKALMVPAEQEYNARYQPYLPTYTDLINMVVKEVIGIDDFKTFMTLQGFSNIWSQRIWDAHFMPPNYNQILNAYFRGVIDKDKMEGMRTLVDLDPRFKDIWDANVEVIPNISELTNELVKEVIDLPTYEKYIQWHGYSKAWGKRIWDAHFIPPSLGDLLTAWRRGLITTDRLDELMTIVDLDPRFKAIFDTRRFFDPSLSLTRFLYETQAISEDEVTELVRLNGVNPKYEKAVTNYIVRFQERRYRTRFLMSLSTGVIEGAYTPEELTKEVVEAGYTEAVAEWMIKTAEVRKRVAEHKTLEPSAKVLTIGELKKAYSLDLINADALRTELLTRGYELGEVDILINIMDDAKVVATEGRKTVALSITQLLNAYRYNEMTRDDLVIRLQVRGLALDEVETLIKTKEKQWGLGGESA